jgi:hypothetical protein
MIKKEQPSAFEKCFNRADRRIGKLGAAPEDIRTHILRGNIEGAYESAFGFADQAEKLALLARALPAYTGHPMAKERMADAMPEAFTVNMGFTEEGWFCVRLPALLPRKNHGSPAYVAEPLYPAMARFWRGKPPSRYPDNVVVFRHVYDRKRPERRYRDHDNIELSMVLDIVALYVMTDDSPMRCRHFYCSAPGSEDRTEVYVVPREEFVEWVTLEKTMGDEGVDLYESKPELGKKHV